MCTKEFIEWWMRLYLLFLFRELFHFQSSTITLYESNYLCLHFYIPVEL